MKTPQGGKYVAIPGRALLATGGGKRSIPRAMELRNLKPFTKGKGGKLTGARQTFLVKTKSGLPLVMQSTGKQARVVWLFVKRSRLTAKLGFHEAVERRVKADVARTVGMRLTQAIASAKKIVKGGGVTSTRL